MDRAQCWMDMLYNHSLTQFPVTDALPRHGCPPVKVLVRVLDPELHVVVHAPHMPQEDQAPSTESAKLEKQLNLMRKWGFSLSNSSLK